MGSVVGKLTLVEIFLWVLKLYLVVIIPQMIRTSLSLSISYVIGMTNKQAIITFNLAHRWTWTKEIIQNICDCFRNYEYLGISGVLPDLGVYTFMHMCVYGLKVLSGSWLRIEPLHFSVCFCSCCLWKNHLVGWIYSLLPFSHKMVPEWWWFFHMIKDQLMVPIGMWVWWSKVEMLHSLLGSSQSLKLYLGIGQGT